MKKYPRVGLHSLVGAALGFLALHLATPAHAQMKVWRCGSTYTNNPVEADAKGCSPLAGGDIRVIQGPSPFGTIPPGSTMVTRASNGHFLMDATLNGVPMRCLVDTGASSVAVSDAVAREAGLQVTRRIMTQTAGGPRVVYAGIARVQAGSLAVPYAEVTAGLPPTAGACLLGQSFLRHFDLQMSGDMMVLRPRN